MASEKVPTRAGAKEAESPPKESENVRTMAETTELASLPMASEKASRKEAEKVRTMAETTEPESLPKASAKAQRIGSLTTGRTATVPATASRKGPLRADRTPMEPGKMMAFLTDLGSPKVSLRALTKAEPM